MKKNKRRKSCRKKGLKNKREKLKSVHVLKDNDKRRKKDKEKLKFNARKRKSNKRPRPKSPSPRNRAVLIMGTLMIFWMMILRRWNALERLSRAAWSQDSTMKTMTKTLKLVTTVVRKSILRS